MAEQDEPNFASLLRQLRIEARLTQEELAEAAGISARSVSDLERGVNRSAHKDTALLLAEALGLAGQVRPVFVLAARGRAPVREVLTALEARPSSGTFTAAATRTLPRDVAAFTGRQAEVAQLVEAAAIPAPAGGVVGIHAIGGMAGVGKTAFAVHVAHRLADRFPDGQFFLPLHAHTAGHRSVDPSDALASLLISAGVAAQHIPSGLESRAGRWRDHIAGKKILLLLDDAAGHEQVRPLLPGTAGSLVIITSRRRLTALADAAVISLDTLPPRQAAQLLAKLSGRPDLSDPDGPGALITELCGFLPLAIGMIASQLRHHPTRSGSEVAVRLSSASNRLGALTAENLSVAVAFDLSYTDLTIKQQQMFRRLGLDPGPDVDAYAAAALADVTPDTAGRLLDELFDHHLLTEPQTGRYQLHDLLREHARTLAAADNPADNEAALTGLLDYYIGAADAAGRHFVSQATYRGGPPAPPTEDAPDLASLESAAAWLEAERGNLVAAADYAAESGRYLHAVRIAAAVSGFLTARGPWDQARTLNRTALTAGRRAGDRAGQAEALIELGFLAVLAADFAAASTDLREAAQMFADTRDLTGQTYALNTLGLVQVLTGNYAAAATSHQNALELARLARDRLAEADSLGGLGFVQQLTGNYSGATASLQEALSLFGDLGNLKGQAVALNDLGVIQQETGDLQAAAATQERALQIDRDLGDHFGQAIALNDLGVVQREMGDYATAAASHAEALALFLDLGYRVGHLEALNRLGEAETAAGATVEARDHHAQALSIAQDIGVPFEEARALAGVGQSWVADGDLTRAEQPLRQAMAIYRRIGAAAAGGLEQVLRRHGLVLQPAPPEDASSKVAGS
jgi:tetratricopeptide (TPR) repeat protein/transcriptional regulator with XRE-family HTH domain